MREERRAAVLTALVFLGVAAYAFMRVHEALTPFVLAAAFAYVLNPVVVYFEAKGLRRSHLVIAGYVAALALGGLAYAGLKTIVVAQVQDLAANAPSYAKQLQRVAAVQQAKLTRQLPLPPKIAEQALDSVVGSALDKIQSLPTEALGLLPLLVHLLLVPFIGFFFLLDGPGGFDHLIQATPSRFVEQAVHLMGEIDTSLGGYLRGVLITAVAIGLVSFVGLVVLGVDNALVISVLSGAGSAVPYMGAVIGTLVGGAMAWYQFGTVWAFLKVAAFFLAVRAADEVLLQPVISKHSVHLHPMVNLLVLVLGGEMFGFMGLVFAVPAACIIKSLLKVAWSWYASESGLEADYGAAGATVPYT